MSYITRWLYSTSHKDIAILYLGYGLIASMVATGMSLIIRMGAPSLALFKSKLVWVYIHIHEVLKYLCILHLSAWVESNKTTYGIAGNKKGSDERLQFLQSSLRRLDHAEVNKLDTLFWNMISQYTYCRYYQYIISIVIYISIRIYNSWKGYQSCQLACIILIIIKQAAKILSTKKRRTKLRRDLSVKVITITNTSGGLIVVSNTRNGMNVLGNWYKTKWPSLNVNSLRMYATSTKSNLNDTIFKVRNSKELSAILRNELKVYKQDNRFNNLKNILKDPYFWIAAYNSIKSKPGNMTPGVGSETLDGINFKYFENLSKEIVSGKYKPKPIRRVEIPKLNGKSRPLSISNPRDKIVQAGLACILEAIWEPKFLNTSYGFRPNRSINSALEQLYLWGSRYTWVIQGEITKCFETIPHNIIMNQIKKEINCHLTISLMYKCIRTNTQQDNGTITISKEGTPQGSVLSPILGNIVLHLFDLYLDEYKNKYDLGKRRKVNPEYYKYQNKRIWAKKKDRKNEARNWLVKMRSVPKVDQMDPKFKRLKYIRYADDFVILVIGSYKDCAEIKTAISKFLLTSCGLKLNDEKTKISLLTKNWEFLGITLRKLKRGFVIPIKTKRKGTKVISNSRLLLLAPINKLKQIFVDTSIVKRDKKGNIKPWAQTHLINLTHYEIIKFYNLKINGIMQYYSFVTNRFRLGYLVWLLQASCALTLSRKFKINSLKGTLTKFGKHLTDPDTDIKLCLPKDYKVTHYFNTSKVFNVEQIIKTK